MKRYPCRACGKRFPATHALARHVRFTHPKRKVAHDVVVVSSTEAAFADSPEHVSYALGRIQGWLDAYEEGAGIPRGTLALRVGELLHAAAERAVRGAPRDLPRLRGDTPA